MNELYDMHCHLDFMSNGEEVAAEARAKGVALFANTVTPEGWREAVARFAPFGNVAVGFGMHPWWAAGEPAAQEDAGPRTTSQRSMRRKIEAEAHEQRELTATERARIDEVVGLLNEHDPRFIGEVGLDFGWRHQKSRTVQVELFAAIARWAAAREGKLLSLHSIHAARETIDILEQTGALHACSCVFHWFSGPSDLLKRAVDAGCYFSCGSRMLATGKGREYVKAIPLGQLLLETDAPPERGTAYPFAELFEELTNTARDIEAIKGPGAVETIANTSSRLLAC